MAQVVVGVVGVIIGLVFIYRSREGIEIANRNRVPGTTPATEADRWVFIVMGVLAALAGIAIAVHGLVNL